MLSPCSQGPAGCRVAEQHWNAAVPAQKKIIMKNNNNINHPLWQSCADLFHKTLLTVRAIRDKVLSTLRCARYTYSSVFVGHCRCRRSRYPQPRQEYIHFALVRVISARARKAWVIALLATQSERPPCVRRLVLPNDIYHAHSHQKFWPEFPVVMGTYRRLSHTFLIA